MAPQEYEKKLPELRAGLIEAQLALKKTECSVIILIAGIDGAGKGEMVNLLNEWLDPRGVDTHAFWVESKDKLDRPYYWRFWQALPARGRIGILFGSWYTDPIVDRIQDDLAPAQMHRALERIAFFERMLAEDRTLILKFWFHLPRDIHRKRLADLTRHPESHWRLLPEDSISGKGYKEFCRTAEQAIQATDLPQAPWHLIEATDPHYRNFTVGNILLQTMTGFLSKQGGEQGPPARPRSGNRKSAAPAPQPDVLRKVDLSRSLKKETYRRELERYQDRLGQLAWTACRKKRAAVMVFEGWDAAGKGSCIRRLTRAMDARLYRVVPIAAPTDEERAHHYLWRFWHRIPDPGATTIFDRSWYGRVLVERVEGFASGREWMQAYAEINDFEAQLAEHGILIFKFWLHIDKAEQLRRFEKREKTPYKRYKITAEDWRNREKWELYEAAVNEMVMRTSTERAPWTLVAANDKRFARVRILKRVCEGFETAL